MSARRSARPDDAPAGGRRVLIVLLTGLGDVVHGLPIATALRDSGYARHVTWVAEPMPASLLAHHPCVDDVVVYRRREGAAGVRALARALAGRRRAHGRFDLAINLNVYFKSVWPLVLSRAPHRLTFDRARAKDGIWLAANDHLPPRPRAHTQDMFLEFLAHLGIPHHPPSAPHDWRLTFTAEERAAQGAWLAERSGRPLAVIVPASAIDRKDWPAERWARVVDALAGDFGYEVVLAGGPGARETAIARTIADRATHPTTWAMGDGVRRVAWILERASLVLAPDTGPLHVARALGVPVIGLYGHTNPWRVGPYRAYEDLWVDAYTDPGAEPDASAFDPPAEDRMRWITVEQVVGRVERARREYGGTHAAARGRRAGDGGEDGDGGREREGGNA